MKRITALMLATAMAAALSFAQTQTPAAPKSNAPADPTTSPAAPGTKVKKHSKKKAKKNTDAPSSATNSAAPSNAPAKK